MEITNSTPEDIDAIFELYRLATVFQKDKFPDNLWPQFDERLITSEIAEKRQWKLIIEKQIACIWAVTFNDPQIWEEKDADPAIYLHRIATNPNFRGHQFVSKIVDWAKPYASTMNKMYIRMDTCGNNTRLIQHYKNSGFQFLGMSKIKTSEGLPSHYKNAQVCRFEIALL